MTMPRVGYPLHRQHQLAICGRAKQPDPGLLRQMAPFREPEAG